jgi:hypothetical protein
MRISGRRDALPRRTDGRATWHASGRNVTIRVPWMQLGIVDPSSHRALVHPTEALRGVSAPASR